MFPTASSHVYYNEAGEVLGWDSGYGYEPDYDPYAEGTYRDYDTEPEPLDPAKCKHESVDMIEPQEDGSAEGWCYRCDSQVYCPDYASDEPAEFRLA